MTPKEKAEDLIRKMSVIHYVKFGKKDRKGMPVSMRFSQVKQCALNCVDEIIKSGLTKKGFKEMYPIGFLEYWREVKQELEKM